MKKLPETNLSYRGLDEILAGEIKARIMMTAVELKIFDELDEFHTADAVAEKLGANPGNTRRFLDALATIDLVEKQGGMYRNTPESMEFLVAGSPNYKGDYFKLVHRNCVTPLDNLAGLVMNGPPTGADITEFASEENWAESTKTGAAWALGEVGCMVADIISSLPGFKNCKKMLDLGGGHGIFALYIVDAHTDMKGVVFDRPSVVKTADYFIREYGMENRMSVMAGDYMTDDIGSGYDLIWACATLNFAKNDLDSLFCKIYDALNPDGYFVAFQDGMTHEHTKPQTMLGHLCDSMRGDSDFTFRQGEIAEAMIRCGFRSVHSRTVGTMKWALDMDVAGK